MAHISERKCRFCGRKFRLTIYLKGGRTGLYCGKACAAKAGHLKHRAHLLKSIIRDTPPEDFLRHYGGLFDGEGSAHVGISISIRKDGSRHVIFRPAVALQVGGGAEILRRATRYFGGYFEVRSSKNYDDIACWALGGIADIERFIGLIVEKTIIKRNDLLLLKKIMRLIQEPVATTESGLLEILTLISQFRHKKAIGWSPDTIKDEIKNGAIYYSEPHSYPGKELI